MSDPFFLLLDEIQLLDSFSGTLNGFLHHPNFDVYVTGSNSKLLSGRLALLSADFSQQTTVTKLNPTKVYLGYTPTTIQELCISYETVVGANRYYAYVEDKVFKEQYLEW